MDEFPFGYVQNKQGQDSHAIADWKHIDGRPNDLAHKSDITVAINGLNKFDPNKVFTKDEVNAAIVKAIGDLQDDLYGTDPNAARETIKQIVDAYNDSNSTIQALLTQVSRKADLDNVYTKKDADARFAAKSDIPDPTQFAKQVDLSLVEKYGLPRNYWIVKNQTSGYSMDSAGNPTVANASVVVSDYVPLDRTGQFEFLGWNGLGSSLVAVYYYDANKNYLTATMWTTPAAVTPATKVREAAVEIWKYGPSNASYIRVESHLGLDAKLAIWSEVFRENSDYVPALEDLKTGTADLSNYYDKKTSDLRYPIVDNNGNVHVNDMQIGRNGMWASALMAVPAVQYPRHETIDLTKKSIGIGGDDWNIHAANLEIVQYSETEGALDFNMVADDGYTQNAWTTKNDMLEISFYDFWDLTVNGNHYDSNNGFSCLTDGGVPFSTFVSSYRTGHMKIGFKTFGTPIGANDWRMINMHVPLTKG